MRPRITLLYLLAYAEAGALAGMLVGIGLWIVLVRKQGPPKVRGYPYPETKV